MSGPDYESLYRNQVRVTAEIEGLRVALFGALHRRSQRIDHLNKIILYQSVAIAVLAVAFIISVLF